MQKIEFEKQLELCKLFCWIVKDERIGHRAETESIQFEKEWEIDVIKL